MKLVFIMLIFIATNSMGQDSCYLAKVDQFTNAKTYVSNVELRTSDNIDFRFFTDDDKHTKGVYMSINTNTTLSVDENSYCIILFTDGTKNEYVRNVGSYNLSGKCLFGFYTASIGGFKKKLNEVLTKNIKAIRISGFSTTYDIEFSPEFSENFKATMNCVYKAWIDKK